MYQIKLPVRNFEMMSMDILDETIPRLDDDSGRQKVTSKFSEFLRTFQHHRSLSLFAISEVRLKKITKK